MGKIGPTQRQRSITAFKKFLYEPGEGHFFMFCETHRNLLQRKQDLVDVEQDMADKCDYPNCQLEAGYVFFPNLVTVLKRKR